nr:adenylate/guanylate cyclase domain-containing protein [Chloroflexota bacterium]
MAGPDNVERTVGELGVRPDAGREDRRLVTVLFSDIVGSSGLADRLDPETLRGGMERYFEAMREVLEEHGGTVEKFIGDAIMAVFGIPRVREDDALRAVRAAISMRTRIRAPDLVLAQEVTLAARTGIASGEVVAGDGSSGQLLVTTRATPRSGTATRRCWRRWPRARRRVSPSTTC